MSGRRGKFEHADGGTLFLDEVSDLSVSAQAGLLRAIQDLSVERVGGTGTHRLDIRIVAATNRSSGGTSSSGSCFGPDVYYRLSGVDVRVPALRERRADILSSRAFLERHRGTCPWVVDGAADALVAHDWPGNVRELERLIERAVALAATDVIQLDDLPPAVRGDYAVSLMPSIDRSGNAARLGDATCALLERCHGNKREACRVLDISYHTLQAYLRQFPPVDAAGPSGGWEPGGSESGEGLTARSRAAPRVEA